MLALRRHTHNAPAVLGEQTGAWIAQDNQWHRHPGLDTKGMLIGRT
jgi:hypothetical protein